MKSYWTLENSQDEVFRLYLRSGPEAVLSKMKGDSHVASYRVDLANDLAKNIQEMLMLEAEVTLDDGVETALGMTVEQEREINEWLQPLVKDFLED